jgi:hypothetical protein
MVQRFLSHFTARAAPVPAAIFPGRAVEMRVHARLIERPSRLATTTVASPLPMRLVRACASDMKRSTPRINAMLATGIVPIELRAANDDKPLPITPPALFAVNNSAPTMPSSCARGCLLPAPETGPPSSDGCRCLRA